MLQVNLHESSLSDIVDRVHQLFERWEQPGSALPRIDEETLVCTRIVLHEWVANLIQYGDFGDRRPEVTIRLQFEEGRAECRVRDNSNGFDLTPFISVDPAWSVHTMPTRGTGLAMLRNCTDRIDYHRTPGRDNELSFSVSAEPGRFRTLYAMVN